MEVTIRPFEQDDYPAVCAVSNASGRGRRRTVAEWRRRDGEEARLPGRRPEAEADAPPRWRRWVAERNRTVIGYVECREGGRASRLRVRLHPAFRGGGIRKALYNQAKEALACREQA